MTMFTWYVLEKNFGHLLNPNLDKRAAFLTEDFDQWYHGGLEDMGTHIAWKWA